MQLAEEDVNWWWRQRLDIPSSFLLFPHSFAAVLSTFSNPTNRSTRGELNNSTAERLTQSSLRWIIDAPRCDNAGDLLSMLPLLPKYQRATVYKVCVPILSPMSHATKRSRRTASREEGPCRRETRERSPPPPRSFPPLANYRSCVPLSRCREPLMMLNSLAEKDWLLQRLSSKTLSSSEEDLPITETRRKKNSFIL